jgi:hypothetical protein
MEVIISDQLGAVDLCFVGQVVNPMPLTLSRRVLFHSKKKEKAGQIKSNGLCF